MNEKNELYSKHDLYMQIGDLVAVADDSEKADFVMLHSICAWMVGDKRRTLKSMKRRLAKEVKSWIEADKNSLSCAKLYFVKLVAH